MKNRVTEALREIIPLQAAAEFTQAMMELGATVCLPNGAPLCAQCPAAAFCEAHRTGRTDRLPVKKAAKARRVEQRDVFLCFHRNKVALRRRPPGGLLAGLWEFPNELAPAQSPLVGSVCRKGSGKHIFSHVEWHITIHLLRADSDDLPEGWVWADRTELETVYAIPNAFDCCRAVIEDILTY